jgi:hypothetical protein
MSDHRVFVGCVLVVGLSAAALADHGGHHYGQGGAGGKPKNVNATACLAKCLKATYGLFRLGQATAADGSKTRSDCGERMK